MNGFGENFPVGASFNSSQMYEMPVQLQSYADELQAAMERRARSTPRLASAHNFGSEPLDRVQVGRFYMLGENLGDNEQRFASPTNIAELVANYECARTIFDQYSPTLRTWEGEMVEGLLTTRQWQSQVVSAFDCDVEYAFRVRDHLGMMSDEKVRSVNIMRFASRNWLNRFPREQRDTAESLARNLFQQLFKDEFQELEDQSEAAYCPQAAFEIKQEGINKISDYAFAGLPMSMDDAQSLVDCMKFQQ